MNFGTKCTFQYEHSLESLNLMESTKESARKKISKLFSAFLFCLNDLGLWLALKVGVNSKPNTPHLLLAILCQTSINIVSVKQAAEFSFCDDMDICCWGQLDLSGEEIIKNFNKDAYKVISTYLPSGTSNPELVMFQCNLLFSFFLMIQFLLIFLLSF